MQLLISKFFNFFLFHQPQEPHNLLKGMILGYCIDSRRNGKFFKILVSAISKNVCNFFLFFESLKIFIIFSGMRVLGTSSKSAW